MKPTYLIPDVESPDVRVRLTRPANDVILDLFAAAPDIQVVEVASGLSNEAHARYQRDGETVMWYARVQSRPNKRPRTVAQSPNAGTWVCVGAVEPTTPTIDREPGPPEDWEFEVRGDDEEPTKWDKWFAQKKNRAAFHDAVTRLVGAGAMNVEDVYPHLRK